MEITTPSVARTPRAYFLQQGRGIQGLHDHLSTHLLSRHSPRWLSVLLETAAVLGGLALLLTAYALPDLLAELLQWLHRSQKMDQVDWTSVNLALYMKPLWSVIGMVRFVLVALAVPLFLLARLVARNRRKSTVLRQAFVEVDQLKLNFDTAAKRYEF